MLSISISADDGILKPHIFGFVPMRHILVASSLFIISHFKLEKYFLSSYRILYTIKDVKKISETKSFLTASRNSISTTAIVILLTIFATSALV